MAREPGEREACAISRRSRGELSARARFSSIPVEKEPMLQAPYKSPRAGKFRVACGVQDDVGDEGIWRDEIEVN